MPLSLAHLRSLSPRFAPGSGTSSRAVLEQVPPRVSPPVLEQVPPRVSRAVLEQVPHLPRGTEHTGSRPGTSTTSSTPNHLSSLAVLEQVKESFRARHPGTVLENILAVDASRADQPNPEQPTPDSHMLHLNTHLAKCLSGLLDFFAEKDVGGNEGGPLLTLSLHPPVYTCDQAQRLCPALSPGGSPMKNLFLRDKKRKMYLLSALVDTEVKIGKLPFAKNLGFASPELLKDALELLPGTNSSNRRTNHTGRRSEDII